MLMFFIIIKLRKNYLDFFLHSGLDRKSQYCEKRVFKFKFDIKPLITGYEYW